MEAAMNNDIENAIERLRVKQPRLAKLERYYAGDHDLAFATAKFQNAFGTMFREFALNLCPAICDAVRDRLRVTGFGVESNGSDDEAAVRTGQIATGTRRIWRRNQMDARSGVIHKEALKMGDSYAIVWPDETGKAVIFPNRSAACTAAYDDETPGRIKWAAKYWRRADRRIRLNLFYPDRIEKYISHREHEALIADARDFEPCEGGAGEEQTASIVRNPYGVVPLFHFANNSGLDTEGISEIAAAIPIQDGLNKAVLDMLVAMEFCAYRQRWAAGIEIEYDADGKPRAPFTAGIDHLWISENPNTRFGDFEAANLEQFLKVKDGFRVDMASVTGTPISYLLPPNRGFPSGEALRNAETRFIAKVRDRQASFGQSWADVLAFAVRIEGAEPRVRLVTNWEDAARMSVREKLENIILKKEIGISTEQALLEAGYGAAELGKVTEPAA